MNQNTNTDNTAGAVAQERLVPRFWVSWVQPTKDHRPLGYPPHSPVLGWWCSGYDSDDNATLVALIEAADEKSAEEVIKKEWPEWTEWRFIEPRDHDYRPGDRFPLSDWMGVRINSGNGKHIHHYPRGRKAKTGLIFKLRENIENSAAGSGWMMRLVSLLDFRAINNMRD